MAEKPAAEKLSHASVGYERPSQHVPEKCILCAHFIHATPARCEGVKSPIRPGDWCEHYEKR